MNQSNYNIGGIEYINQNHGLFIPYIIGYLIGFIIGCAGKMEIHFYIH